MLLEILKRAADLLVGLLVLALVAALLHGIFLMVGQPTISLVNAGWVAGGAIALALLPKSFSITRLFHSGWIGVFAAVGFGAAYVQLAALNITMTSLNQNHNITLLNWGLGLLALYIAACIRDYSRQQEESNSLFEKRDWLIALSLTVAAAVGRSLGDQSAAIDELMHYSEMQYLLKTPNVPLIGTFSTGYPNLTHRLVFILSKFLFNYFDSFQLEKLLSVSIAGASVGLWYLVVRIFAPLHIALSASIMLLLLGWHWLNSRFLYLYPHDLGVIALGVLLTFVTFKQKQWRTAVATGFLLIYAFILQKCSIMLFPFVAYVALDSLLFSRRQERLQVLKITAVIIFASAFAYVPVFYGFGGTFSSPRVGLAIAAHDRLAQHGLDKLTVFPFGFKDAFSQFYGTMHDISRHVFRGGGPLLDPILASVFSVGAALALGRIFKERASRFQLFGLIAFIIPMIITFPLDSEGPFGLSRRMMGASFFVVWIGAIGADCIAKRIANPRFNALVTICLAILSMIINGYHIKASYLQREALSWYFDYGGARAAMLNIAHDFARRGTHVFIYNAGTTAVADNSTDLPKLHYHSTLETLRQNVLELKGQGWGVVIIPWGQYSQIAPDVAEQLSDLVPINTWQMGPPDPQGLPIFRYGFTPGR